LRQDTITLWVTLKKTDGYKLRKVKDFETRRGAEVAQRIAENFLRVPLRTLRALRVSNQTLSAKPVASAVAEGIVCSFAGEQTSGIHLVHKKLKVVTLYPRIVIKFTLKFIT